MKLHLKLENCHGIGSLEHSFDFTKHRIFTVYAPNGSMKTSFAKTFTDLQQGIESKDHIYDKRRPSSREIKIDDNPIKDTEILVINSYEDEYKYSPNVAKLLANKDLKEEYKVIHEEIAKQKEPLTIALEDLTGNAKGAICEEQLAMDVTSESNESAFFTALIRLEDEVNLMKEDKLSHLKYNIIFNQKTEKVFSDTKFQEFLKQYLEKYDELIKASNFFKAGVFDHNNISDIIRNLKDNNFFHKDLNNGILLNGESIATDERLQNIVDEELQKIINNKELKKLFDKVNKILCSNPQLRDFSKYLKENRIILEEIENPQLFKEKIWKSYLHKNLDLYNSLVELYKEKRKRLLEIKEEIKNDIPRWNKVISIFNSRFHVPFRLEVENREDTVLKESYPKLEFYFEDESIDQEKLVRDVLSQGEKRALYLMRVIFDIEARKITKQKTLFVIDDIADSFDYQNKYAIIEYLRDILEEDGVNFYQIILTHNYDFYRTVGKRLIHGNNYNEIKKHKLNVVKHDSKKIELQVDKYQNNPFDTWKSNLDDDVYLIASIPFIRNITEYCNGTQDNISYNNLTSLLHKKGNTDDIRISELLVVFTDVIPNLAVDKVLNKERLVKDVIYSVAKDLASKDEDYLQLENKIVLSIAIRLRAEEFMIQKINDSEYCARIEGIQTYTLIKKYKELFPRDDAGKNLLNKVNIITPENIHINSFMYEPILDMSSNSLKALYKEFI